MYDTSMNVIAWLYLLENKGYIVDDYTHTKVIEFSPNAYTTSFYETIGSSDYATVVDGHGDDEALVNWDYVDDSVYLEKWRTRE